MMAGTPWVWDARWLIIDDEVARCVDIANINGTAYVAVEYTDGQMTFLEFEDVCGARYFPTQQAALDFLSRQQAVQAAE
jgi:hypothetical protein